MQSSFRIRMLRRSEADVLHDGKGKRLRVAKHAVFPPLADQRRDEAAGGIAGGRMATELAAAICGAAHFSLHWVGDFGHRLHARSR